MTKPGDQWKWQELEVGFVVLEPGSAKDYKTGDWKSEHPVWNESLCIKCGLCYTYCPDMARLSEAEPAISREIMTTARAAASAPRNARPGPSAWWREKNDRAGQTRKSA